jgi:hypothetical protein
MGWLRELTQNHIALVERNVDNDAPGQMRDELVDFFFHLAEESNGQAQPRAIYEATGLMLGAGITANPYGGYPARVSRDIGNAFWARVYDRISRISPSSSIPGLHSKNSQSQKRSQKPQRSSPGFPTNRQRYPTSTPPLNPVRFLRHDPAWKRD